MEREDRTILVTGATGRQGHSTVRYLREAGWRVRALTRFPDAPEAQDIHVMGAEVFEGDLDNPDSVKEALTDVYGVFSVLTFLEEGVPGEVNQGFNLAEEAKRAGVEHFIYSSMGGADRRTGIPHFESKRAIENHIISLNLPYTFLRPAFFMENFNVLKTCRSIQDGKLFFPMPPDKPLQMIALDDIGFFAAMAFDRPELMIGKGVELAGDELTMVQISEMFSRALGRDVEFVQMPFEEAERLGHGYRKMFEWFAKKGYQADIDRLRGMHPSMLTFEAWLNSGYWIGTSSKKKVMEGVRA